MRGEEPGHGGEHEGRLLGSFGPLLRLPRTRLDRLEPVELCVFGEQRVAECGDEVGAGSATVQEAVGLGAGFVDHALPADERVCKACGGELTEMAGVFEESELITVSVRNFLRQLHRQQKYRCRCNGCIKTAPGPMRLVDGGRFSIEITAEVAAAKYSDHMPLTRQARVMGYEGLVTDSQTLWDQINALAKLLAPTST